MSIGRVPGATGIQPSIVTAKGDLIVATASGSVTNQAVGSNNQVLTADSAQADGVKWANGSAATLTTTGDLLYASAANTPARLGIGSTGQVLTVSGGVPTWAAASSGALTKIKTATFSNVADTGTTFDSVFTSTYNNYKVIFWNVYTVTNAVDFRFQLRNGGTTQNTAYYGNYVIGVTKTDIPNAQHFTMGQLRNNSVQSTALDMTVFRNNNRLAWFFNGVERTTNYTIFGGGFSDNVASNGADGFILSTSSGNIYGTVTVYGYEA